MFKRFLTFVIILILVGINRIFDVICCSFFLNFILVSMCSCRGCMWEYLGICTSQRQIACHVWVWANHESDVGVSFYTNRKNRGLSERPVKQDEGATTQWCNLTGRQSLHLDWVDSRTSSIQGEHLASPAAAHPEQRWVGWAIWVYYGGIKVLSQHRKRKNLLCHSDCVVSASLSH